MRSGGASDSQPAFLCVEFACPNRAGSVDPETRKQTDPANRGVGRGGAFLVSVA